VSDQTLYEEDILLWSEQQAAAIRRLGQGGSLVPNDLDVENVAEEIESVGRSELAAVESHIRLILVHLIKLRMEPTSDAVRHWRSEIVGFSSDARRRYTPSMRQRIDLDAIWCSAREQAMVAYDESPQDVADTLPTRCPFTVEELLADRIDILALQARLTPDAQ
jgi:hypothetical protein